MIQDKSDHLNHGIYIMNMKPLLVFLSLSATSLGAVAGDIADAALGGGIGGALGAAIGNEVGGRDGAILGGAVGAAAGTAVTTRDQREHDRDYDRRRYDDDRRSYRKSRGHFCPPGQAKKGNC
ncbi:MAG: hypothetical protein Marn2KO_11300 [Marinobacter nauticus]